MPLICRNPEGAARQRYDLIVVGGGIYGAMLTLEAARRGLKPLLLERGDFGSGTSFNSLRIVHGGLRYLQGMDLYRFYESVQERRWFLSTFPDLVSPLRCLMPLYGERLRRRSVLRVALFVNDLLSIWRNWGVEAERCLPSGRILSAREVRGVFPQVDPRGLDGAALWYDAQMLDSQRILVEVLRWACSCSAVALNYVEVIELLTRGGYAFGVRGRDLETGHEYEYRADVVVNAAGPWNRTLAKLFHRDEPTLFRPTLAWNVLFERTQLSEHGLALTPRRPGAQTYFVTPFKGKILAGTGHAPWDDGPDNVQPAPVQLAAFIEDINDAVPGLGLRSEEIVRVFSGLLPASDDARSRLAVREVIFDHGAVGGPRGLYSISGVKFTTSRRVAEKALQRMFGKRLTSARRNRPAPQRGWASAASKLSPEPTRKSWRDEVRRIVEEEAVMHLDDLVVRRTVLWEEPTVVRTLSPHLCHAFGWEPERVGAETKRLAAALRVESQELTTAWRPDTPSHRRHAG